MRKYILLFLTLIATLNSSLSQSIDYNLSIEKIEGGSFSLGNFQSRKILFITLPIAQSPTADSLLFSLDTLAAGNTGSLKIIAIPAIEDGFNDSIKTSVQQWYRNYLNDSILITAGMHTRKTSGHQQHILFRWLTSVSENGVFDLDVIGPDSKYFIRPGGELFSVLLPPTKIWGSRVENFKKSIVLNHAIVSR